MDELNTFISNLDLVQYTEFAKIGLYGGTATLIVATLFKQLRRTTELAWYSVVMLTAVVVCAGGALVIYSQKEGQYRQECSKRVMADERADMWKAIALGNENEALAKFKSLEDQYNRSAPSDFKEVRKCIDDITNNNDLHDKLKGLVKDRKVEDLISDLSKILAEHKKDVDRVVDNLKNYK